MLNRCLLVLTLLFAGASFAAPASQVILVTADGLRWQEVFRGADDRLLRDERFVPKNYSGFPSYQSGSKEAARHVLMPFFWDTLSTQGSTIGNRDQGSPMRVTNPWWFSYPGYNEILTGRADPAIDSNDKRPNPNVTVLEWLNHQRSFAGKVQAFGSWDVFPWIINAERSGIPVNAGFMPVTDRPTPQERFLNDLQIQLPTLWPTVRVDALTHQYSLEAMRSDRPRVVYISYGETDDFAHEGHYDQYLDAAHRFDGFLRELWRTIQSDRFYKNRTVLLVTTDHGRGEFPLEAWQHHSSAEAVRASPTPITGYENGIVGSDQIWLAAIGPGIAARGNVQTEADLTQSQVAATLLRALGIERSEFDSRAAAAIDAIFR
jgi:Type I phosphodiesterase / nucleotide pyrophosphatase